jgi:hypothetical protein
MNTHLVVCRNVKSLNSLKSIMEKIDGDIVVATDSIEIKEFAPGIGKVRDILFLEKMESLYTVSDQVVTILNEINLWLREVAQKTGLPVEVMFWPAHCEGGGCTQRIQDGLLLMNSYKALIEEVNPFEIILIKEPGYSYEDSVFICCSAYLRITCKVINNWKSKFSIAEIQSRAYPLLKELYTAGLVVFYKASINFFTETKRSKNDVVIQVCGAVSKKIINHTVPLIKSLNRVGFNGIALCWGTGKSIISLRKNNITTVPLEIYVTWRTLLKSWYLAILVWRFSNQIKTTFLEQKDCEHQILRNALWITMKEYLIGDVPRRYRLYKAAYSYWKKNPTCAARLWTRVMPEGVITYRAIPKERPIFQFWQPGWPYQLYWPYKTHDIPVDYTFALSSAHISQLTIDENIPGNMVIPVGMPWIKFIKDFSVNNSQSISRRTLYIPTEAKLCIFVDAFDSIRGYLSVAEQALFMNCILRLIVNNPEIYFIVKARPSPRKESFELFFTRKQYPNLIVLPRGDLPYHAINASNLILTKFSTLTVEGMILKVPSVGLILDGEKHFAFSENAMHYSYSIEDFTELINGLIGDINKYNDWRDELMRNAEIFLNKHLYIEQDSNSLIANKLAEILL